MTVSELIAMLSDHFYAEQQVMIKVSGDAGLHRITEVTAGWPEGMETTGQIAMLTVRPVSK